MDTINMENKETSTEKSAHIADAKNTPRRGRPKKASSTKEVAPIKTIKSDKAVKMDKPLKVSSTKTVAQVDKNLQTNQSLQISNMASSRKSKQCNTIQEGQKTAHCRAQDTFHKEHCTHRHDAKACHEHHSLHPYHTHGTDHQHDHVSCHDHHSRHDSQPQHALGQNHPCFERAQRVKKKRKLAKIGMTASLGLLTITAFSHILPYTKRTHTIAGLAMLGFSLWHANLYKSPHKKKASTKKHIQENLEQVESC